MSGEVVHVEFRKWPDTLHWRYSMTVFAEDRHGLWLWAPAGTPTQRGSEPATAAPHGFVKLIAPDRWSAAIWNEAGKYDVYVDVNTPPDWDGDTVRMIDLDLDVVRYRADGRVAVLDEAEFDQHRRELGYPRHLVDGARRSAADLAAALDGRREPYGRVGAARLAEARGAAAPR